MHTTSVRVTLLLTLACRAAIVFDASPRKQIERRSMDTRSGRGRLAGRGRDGSRGPARSQGHSTSRAASGANSPQRLAVRGRARSVSPRASGGDDADANVRQLLAESQAQNAELRAALLLEKAKRGTADNIRGHQHDMPMVDSDEEVRWPISWIATPFPEGFHGGAHVKLQHVAVTIPCFILPKTAATKIKKKCHT